MKRIFSSHYFRYALFAIVGLFFGWIIFHSPDKKEERKDVAAQVSQSTIWTCSMHPQIRKPDPGKCPICGMDLIPLKQGGTELDTLSIHLSQEAAQLANVQTSVVARQSRQMEVRLYGKVQPDERLLQSQVAYITGRIEKLMVNYTGETVRKDQPLALIYSPDLVTAQQELLEASSLKKSQPEIYEAAKDKLRQWKLTDRQISAIESRNSVENNIEITATTSGIVTAKNVNKGDYIAQGTVLFEIADLSRVWVMFDAYESDLPFIKRGDMLSFFIQALPDRNLTGIISFIDPVLDPNTRTASVRVEMGNLDGKFKPEMFASAIIRASLSQYSNKLVIPRSAVLWTGKRSIVYVKQPGTDEPIFRMRTIEIGPLLANSYVVESGLSEGEEIVTQGTFSVDAAAQLEGKPSMMSSNIEAAAALPTHTDMHEMNMPAGKPQAKASTKQQKMIRHTTFTAYGNCEMCKDRIETAAKSVKGVTRADWSIDTKQLHVEYDKSQTSLDAVHRAIAKVGHDTDKMKADDKTYNSLPSCCHYRK